MSTRICLMMLLGVSCTAPQRPDAELTFDTTLDFGPVPGGTIATRQLHVTNTSTRAIVLDRFDESGQSPEFTSRFVPARLLPGETMAFDVVFTAPDISLLARKATTFTLGWNDREATVSVEAVAVFLDCSGAMRLEFGNVPVEEVAHATFLVVNKMPISGHVQVNDVHWQSVPGDFRLLDAGTYFLQPGQPLMLSAEFRPSLATDLGASVRVRPHELCPIDEIQLHGRGLLVAADCEPQRVDFHAMLLGGTSYADVRVRNFTSRLLELEIDGGEFAFAGDGGVVLMPGTTTLPLSFTPRVAGSRSGTLIGGAPGGSRPYLSCELVGYGVQ